MILKISDALGYLWGEVGEDRGVGDEINHRVATTE